MWNNYWHTGVIYPFMHQIYLEITQDLNLGRSSLSNMDPSLKSCFIKYHNAFNTISHYIERDDIRKAILIWKIGEPLRCTIESRRIIALKLSDSSFIIKAQASENSETNENRGWICHFNSLPEHVNFKYDPTKSNGGYTLKDITSTLLTLFSIDEDSSSSSSSDEQDGIWVKFGTLKNMFGEFYI